MIRSDLATWDEMDCYKYYGKQQQPQSDFIPLAEVDSYYPITKVLWEPRKVGCCLDAKSNCHDNGPVGIPF